MVIPDPTFRWTFSCLTTSKCSALARLPRRPWCHRACGALASKWDDNQARWQPGNLQQKVSSGDTFQDIDWGNIHHFPCHYPALLGRQGTRLLTHNNLQLKVMKTRELSAEIAKCEFTAPKVEIGSPARWRIVFRVWSCLEVLMTWLHLSGNLPNTLPGSTRVDWWLWKLVKSDLSVLKWTRPVRVIMRDSAFLDWTPMEISHCHVGITR